MLLTIAAPITHASPQTNVRQRRDGGILLLGKADTVLYPQLSTFVPVLLILTYSVSKSVSKSKANTKLLTVAPAACSEHSRKTS